MKIEWGWNQFCKNFNSDFNLFLAQIFIGESMQFKIKFIADFCLVSFHRESGIIELNEV